MADDLTVGTRIYRPARLAAVGAGSQVLMESPSMQDFGDGTVMLRAVFDAALGPHWRVAAWEEQGGRVCVCDEPIPGGLDLLRGPVRRRQLRGGLAGGRRPGGVAASRPNRLRVGAAGRGWAT